MKTLYLNGLAQTSWLIVAEHDAAMASRVPDSGGGAGADEPGVRLHGVRGDSAVERPAV